MPDSASRDWMQSDRLAGAAPARQLLWSASAFVSDFARYARTDGIAAVLLIALSASLEGAGLLLLVPILDVLTGQGGMSGWVGHYALPWLISAGLITRSAKMAALFLLFAAIVTLRSAAVWKRDVVLTQLRVGFVERQRQSLAVRLASAPWSHLSRISHAEVNHLFSSDVVLTGSCVHYMLQSAVAICLLAVQCAIAFFCAPLLAAAVCLFMAGATALFVPQLIEIRRLGAAVVEGNLALAGSGARFLGGLKLAVSQDVQSRFVAEFGTTMQRIVRPQIDMIRMQGRMQFLFGVLSALLGGGAVLAGLVLLGLPSSLLVLFVFVLVRMSSPATLLQQCAPQFVNTLASYEKVRALMATLPAERMQRAPALSARGWTSIVFDNVTYRHQAQKGVFDLTLSITAGEVLGISGASGAGKTTLVDLLVGLIAPQEGKILVDAKPLTVGESAGWRSSLSYVAQDGFLFRDTIRTNLLWADGEHSDDEIWSVLRLTGADAVVARLAEGLDAIVGERGCSLSGGERQRLALSRALMSRPRLLVLDEATNALDPAGERQVLNALRALPWNPTIVLVAHRAESFGCCTRIVRLSNGRLMPQASVAAVHSRRLEAERRPR